MLPSSHYSGRGKHFFALLLIVIGYPVDSFRFTPLRPLPLPVSEGGHNPGPLPNYTNQAMNRDIKELCKLAGINEEIRVTTYKGNVRTDKIQPKWELVGTHTGRRTFIVNALSMGITPNVVMKWTGHSDYKAMKPYIDIVDSIKASSMAKFDGLI